MLAKLPLPTTVGSSQRLWQSRGNRCVTQQAPSVNPGLWVNPSSHRGEGGGVGVVEERAAALDRPAQADGGAVLTLALRHARVVPRELLSELHAADGAHGDGHLSHRHAKGSACQANHSEPTNETRPEDCWESTNVNNPRPPLFTPRIPGYARSTQSHLAVAGQHHCLAVGCARVTQARAEAAAHGRVHEQHTC
jgi:hypothetical protein